MTPETELLIKLVIVVVVFFLIGIWLGKKIINNLL
jgi:type III secretory pathway component EscS